MANGAATPTRTCRAVRQLSRGRNRQLSEIPSRAVAVGSIQVVVVDGAEFVIWRGADGRVRSAPRICPHLDHDLGEGYVLANELVCAGHAWAFDGDGHAYKRNELGRVDPKGEVVTLDIHEDSGEIRISRHR
ncbi:MAG TPA: Rieske (2Fe-2S) protein [Acidimicrobiia bacterium]|nr:Rieske (2Fe-2S) protein [Acidimicrobiia bacterium]